MISVAGAVAAWTYAWKASRRRGADLDETLSFMARETVVLHFRGVHRTTLAWAFQLLSHEFERGVSPRRWAFLVALPDARHPPSRRSEADERCHELLRELADRGLIQPPPENARRQDQWWLSEAGRVAIRRTRRSPARFRTPAHPADRA